MDPETLRVLLSMLGQQPDATSTNVAGLEESDSRTDQELQREVAQAEYNRASVITSGGDNETPEDSQRRFRSADAWARRRDTAQAELDRRWVQRQEQTQQTESILGGR